MLRVLSLFSFFIFLSSSCKLDLNHPSDPKSKNYLLYTLQQFLFTQPQFSIASGHYHSPHNITIEYAFPNAEIYYTTDGSQPGRNGMKYEESIPIWSIAGSDVKAIAFTPDGRTSGVTSLQVSLSHIKTGQNQCWNESGTPISCSGTGQDGDIQAGIEKKYVGPFTENNYPNDFITKDINTALTWKTCLQGLSGNNCSAGTLQTMNFQDAKEGANGCSSLNSQNGGNGFAGKKDWRLPSLEELKTIIDFSTTNVFPTAVFPGSVPQGAWSSTVDPSANFQTIMIFSSGFTGIDANTSLVPVRCVSGKPHQRNIRFKTNEDGTVSDLKTGLIWQKCLQEQTPGSCAGFPSSNTWNTALAYCNTLNLANRTWRLPNAVEMHGLIEVEKPTSSASFVSQEYFPNNVRGMYTTSSTIFGYYLTAHILSDVSILDPVDKTDYTSARCVSGP